MLAHNGGWKPYRAVMLLTACILLLDSLTVSSNHGSLDEESSGGRALSTKSFWRRQVWRRRHHLQRLATMGLVPHGLGYGAFAEGDVAGVVAESCSTFSCKLPDCSGRHIQPVQADCCSGLVCKSGGDGPCQGHCGPNDPPPSPPSPPSPPIPSSPPPIPSSPPKKFPSDLHVHGATLESPNGVAVAEIKLISGPQGGGATMSIVVSFDCSWCDAIHRPTGKYPIWRFKYQSVEALGINQDGTLTVYEHSSGDPPQFSTALWTSESDPETAARRPCTVGIDGSPTCHLFLDDMCELYLYAGDTFDGDEANVLWQAGQYKTEGPNGPLQYYAVDAWGYPLQGPGNCGYRPNLGDTCFEVLGRDADVDVLNYYIAQGMSQTAALVPYPTADT